MDTQASLEAVLDQALAEHTPDAILATGDLAHEPRTDIYARFLETIRVRSDAALLCLPGNHDVLAAMEAAEMPMAPLSLPGWDLVPLDSHEDEVTPALITEEDKAAVAAAIAEARQANLLVATHHPLVAVNSPWLDKDRIQNAAELVDWLSECSAKLRAIVFGHAHQEVNGVIQGLDVYGVPSTCFQFKPASESFAIDDALPGYRWLFLSPQKDPQTNMHERGQIETEVRRADYPINVKLRN